MPIHPISGTIFFTIHLILKYVKSNQSNTRDRKKTWKQDSSVARGGGGDCPPPIGMQDMKKECFKHF